MAVNNDGKTLEFDAEDFRLQIPAYADPLLYPDGLLSAFWDAATIYISRTNFGRLKMASRRYAINLMMAHLIYTQGATQAGTNPFVMEGATIDEVVVKVQAPPLMNAWQSWLNATPYGLQLNALLQNKTAGGLYVQGVGGPMRTFTLGGGLSR